MILSKCSRLSSSGAKYYGGINKNVCRGLRTGSEKGQQASGRFNFRGVKAGLLTFTMLRSGIGGFRAKLREGEKRGKCTAKRGL